jgi:hypothetical protein
MGIAKDLAFRREYRIQIKGVATRHLTARGSDQTPAIVEMGGLGLVPVAEHLVDGERLTGLNWLEGL